MGVCCEILTTGKVVICLANKNKRWHKMAFDGLLHEMIHLAKPAWKAEKVDQERFKHSDSAMEYARIFAYDTTHKGGNPI